MILRILEKSKIQNLKSKINFENSNYKLRSRKYSEHYVCY